LGIAAMSASLAPPKKPRRNAGAVATRKSLMPTEGRNIRTRSKAGAQPAPQTDIQAQPGPTFLPVHTPPTQVGGPAPSVQPTASVIPSSSTAHDSGEQDDATSPLKCLPSAPDTGMQHEDAQTIETASPMAAEVQAPVVQQTSAEAVVGGGMVPTATIAATAAVRQAPASPSPPTTRAALATAVRGAKAANVRGSRKRCVPDGVDEHGVLRFRAV
jgi:hypothetical protein